ncbi:uncharacterized protein LOC133799890 [Humulus lupulus]|uniref:uncharacterized protein LOC133799890 n=1 Tax=Humulus lupulus TaxID=3486 RepID=UPI002B403777|nr:uncharacterized protein LOC133799890 [Humulus lupulus]
MRKSQSQDSVPYKDFSLRSFPTLRRRGSLLKSPNLGNLRSSKFKTLNLKDLWVRILITQKVKKNENFVALGLIGSVWVIDLIIKVLLAFAKKSLALFPAKFQKSMWIKQGSFVVVDDNGKVKALESGSKVTCIVSKVLFYEQVCAVRKSPKWAEVFKETVLDNSNGSREGETSQQEDNDLESSCDEDDVLPPLEANTNRNRPFELHQESDSGSESDS